MKQAIIVIGGFNSLWPAYLRMARDLEDLTGLRAVGVPLMPWHWWTAGRHEDATDVLRKVVETVSWARRRFQADRFVLVGHSAGGVIGRLYLCERPVWGEVYAGHEHATTLITLGSPHCGSKQTETGWFLTDEANRLVPATPYASQVRYRAVVGRHIRGCATGSYQEHRAFRTYRFFGGDGDIWGDGIVPVHCAELDGADNCILDGVAHSRKVAINWYGGSQDIIRRWWPDEVSGAA